MFKRKKKNGTNYKNTLLREDNVVSFVLFLEVCYRVKRWASVFFYSFLEMITAAVRGEILRRKVSLFWVARHRRVGLIMTHCQLKCAGWRVSQTPGPVSAAMVMRGQNVSEPGERSRWKWNEEKLERSPRQLGHCPDEIPIGGCRAIGSRVYADNSEAL